MTQNEFNEQCANCGSSVTTCKRCDERYCRGEGHTCSELDHSCSEAARSAVNAINLQPNEFLHIRRHGNLLVFEIEGILSYQTESGSSYAVTYRVPVDALAETKDVLRIHIEMTINMAWRTFRKLKLHEFGVR